MEQHPSMNRIYQFDWSQTSQAWVVMAENSRRHGKRSSRGLLSAALSLSTGVALAGPTGGQVVAGQGSLSHSDTTTTIEKSSPTLTLTSQSFNVAPQHRIAINRIFGNSGTPLRLRTSTSSSGCQ
jgi:hypothetical protein